MKSERGLAPPPPLPQPAHPLRLPPRHTQVLLPHEEHAESEEEEEHAEEEEEEHLYGIYRSSTIKPKIWKSATNNRAYFEHHDKFVFFTVPKTYALRTSSEGGKKAPSAAASSHRFNFDIWISKEPEEDKLEFVVGIWDSDEPDMSAQCWNQTLTVRSRVDVWTWVVLWKGEEVLGLACGNTYNTPYLCPPQV